MDKKFISAEQLLNDSYQLGMKVYESGFKPDYIIGVWRGGAPVGIAVQELLDFLGVESDHIAIRTSSYTRSGERENHVRVHGLNYIVKRVNADDSILIVDDVYDTGLSIRQVILNIEDECRRNTPEIKIATPYFKPNKNKTDYIPDYYLHETDAWLVFPHELHGLSIDEILENKPGISSIEAKLSQLKSET